MTLDKNISIRSEKQEVFVVVSLKEEEEERLLEGVDVLLFYQQLPLTSEERKKILLQSDVPGSPEKVNVRFKGPRAQIDLLWVGGDDRLRQKIWPTIFLEDVDSSNELSFDELIAKLPFPFEIKMVTFEKFFNASIKIEPEPDTITGRKVD